jgi:hypothetical protein
MNFSRLYVLINHIIILLVNNFLAIMNKTTKIQKIKIAKIDIDFKSKSNQIICVSQFKIPRFFCAE